MEEEMESMEREMHKATCSECGSECEVPFKPTEGKRVLCNDCFRRNRPPRRSFGNNRGNFRNDRPREMHKATCADCGKECEVPFKPTEGRAVLCQDCFRAKKGSSQENEF